MRHHRITANGISLHVAEIGSGPAVLFCHGFPAIGSSWRRQMEAVAAAGYRGLAPDMRGYGGSDAPEAASAYMPFHTVGDLIAILDHFEIDDCTIVGHDFGGSIAWNAAMMRPDRFSAVFGMSVAFQRPGGPSFLDRLRAAGRDDFYMFAQIRPEADEAWANVAVTIPANYYRMSGEPPAAERGHVFDLASMMRPSVASAGLIDPEYIAEAVAAFAMRGMHGPLNYYRALDPFFAIVSAPYAGATIAQPAWFLTGSEDALRSFHPDETTMRGAVTGLRGYTVLDGIGHWPQLEAADDVNRCLLAFLEDVPRQSRPVGVPSLVAQEA